MRIQSKLVLTPIWLVLTDAQRRIAAEGFALEEIDAKLKAMQK